MEKVFVVLSAVFAFSLTAQAQECERDKALAIAKDRIAHLVSGGDAVTELEGTIHGVGIGSTSGGDWVETDFNQEIVYTGTRTGKNRRYVGRVVVAPDCSIKSFSESAVNVDFSSLGD